MKDVKNLVRAALLLAIAIVVQSIGRSFPQISQLFVGSVVNCILIITVLTSGIRLGILVGGLTPLLAWIIGQLPTPMGPFVPFIMIGNIIYVAIFYVLYKYKNKVLQYMSIIVASILKFVFLYFSASKLIYLLDIGIPKKIASKLVIMMGIPQLITAIIGGILALILIKILAKNRLLYQK